MIQVSPEQCEIQTLRREVSNLLEKKLELDYPALLSATPVAQLVEMTSALRMRLGELQGESMRVMQCYRQSEALVQEQQQCIAVEAEKRRIAEETLRNVIAQQNEDHLYAELYANQQRSLEVQQREIATLKARLAEYAGAEKFNEQFLSAQNDQHVLHEQYTASLRAKIKDLQIYLKNMQEAAAATAQLAFQANYDDLDDKTLEIARLRRENQLLRKQNAEFAGLLKEQDPAQLLEKAGLAERAINENYALKAQLSQARQAMSQLQEMQLAKNGLEQRNLQLEQLSNQLRATAAQAENNLHASEESAKRANDKLEALQRALAYSERQLVLAHAALDYENAELFNQSLLEEKQALLQFLYIY